MKRPKLLFYCIMAFLAMAANQHDWRGFTLSAVYEQLKMVIDFGGNTIKDGEGGYTACPSWGEGNVSSMMIALTGPSDPIDVKTLIGYRFYESPTLEETTGISLDKFYQLMIGEQQPACFQANWK